MAVRHRHTDGFALLEMIIAVSVIAILTSLSVSAYKSTDTSYYTFPMQYLRIQSEAFLTGRITDYTDETNMIYPVIFFYGSGAVNQARTLTFGEGGNRREIVIELGTGKLVFR